MHRGERLGDQAPMEQLPQAVLPKGDSSTASTTFSGLTTYRDSSGRMTSTRTVQRHHHHLSGFIGSSDRSCRREEMTTKSRRSRTTPQWLRNLLLQASPVPFNLFLDAGVVHDPGGIKGVGEEVTLLLLVLAQALPQV